MRRWLPSFWNIEIHYPEEKCTYDFFPDDTLRCPALKPWTRPHPSFSPRCWRAHQYDPESKENKEWKKYQSVSYYHRRRRCLASAIALLRLLEHVGDESITHTHVLRKLRHLAFFNDFSNSFYVFEGADHLDFRVIIFAKSISWHCKKQWTIVVSISVKFMWTRRLSY